MEIILRDVEDDERWVSIRSVNGAVVSIEVHDPHSNTSYSVGVLARELLPAIEAAIKAASETHP